MRHRNIVAGVACCLAWGLAVASPADDLRDLLERNQAEAAYRLGKSQPDQLGNPAFDFFFGIAALDAGRPGEGVLALERYLLNFPANRSARFQLARGYYILGEDQRAREEFDALLPAAQGEEKAAIEQFLDAIRGRESRYTPTASYYVQFGAGYDSNINAGIDSGSRPTVPGVGLLPSQADNSVSVREGDGFGSWSAGGQGTFPVAPGVALFGALAVDGRFHFNGDNDIFDQASIGASGGVSLLKNRNLFKAGASVSRLQVDGQGYLDLTGVQGDWAYQADQFNRYAAGLQVSRLRYDDMCVFALKDKSAPCQVSPNGVRDADVLGLALAWTRAYAASYQPVTTLALTGSAERNEGDRNDLSKDTVGLSVGVNLTPAPRWGLGGRLSVQQTRHQAPFLAVAGSERREDVVMAAELLASYALSKAWSLRGELLYLEQRSNVDLFDYERTTAALKARYEFN